MRKIMFSYLEIKPLNISVNLGLSGLIHTTLRSLRQNRDLDFVHPTLSLRLPTGQFFLLQQLRQRQIHRTQESTEEWYCVTNAMSRAPSYPTSFGGGGGGGGSLMTWKSQTNKSIRNCTGSIQKPTENFKSELFLSGLPTSGCKLATAAAESLGYRLSRPSGN